MQKSHPETGQISTHHIYICKKLGDLNSDETWPRVVEEILSEMVDDQLNEFVEDQSDNEIEPIIRNTLSIL